MQSDIAVALTPSVAGEFVTARIIAAAVLVGFWALLARTAFLQGDDMERPNRVAQLYGYAVCLIAVIVFLISANSFVDHAFTLSNPLRGQGNQFGMEPAITSFEAYRATLNRFGPSTLDGGRPAALPDSALRIRYEALRADRLEQARFDAKRGLTTSGLLLMLSVALFAIHWRWLRARDGAAIRQTPSGLEPPRP